MKEADIIYFKRKIARNLFAISLLSSLFVFGEQRQYFCSDLVAKSQIELVFTGKYSVLQSVVSFIGYKATFVKCFFSDICEQRYWAILFANRLVEVKFANNSLRYFPMISLMFFAVKTIPQSLNGDFFKIG